MKPFADDKGSTSIGDLTAENGTDTVTVSGSLEVTRDKAGLKRAKALKALTDAMVAELEAVGDLPDAVERATKSGNTVANPFT